MVYVLHSVNVLVVISSKYVQVTQLKRQMLADNMELLVFACIITTSAWSRYRPTV